MAPTASRPLLRPLKGTALALACAGALTAVGACGIIPAPVRQGAPPEGRPGDEPSATAEPSPTAAEESPTEPETEYRSGPVPSGEPEFDESVLGPAPSADDFTGAVEYEINRFVNSFAMEHDPDSSVTCEEIGEEQGFEGTCDAVYSDFESEFTVVVTDAQGSVEYETGRLPVSREAVEERYRHHASEEEVLCDMLEYQLVSSGSSGIVCEAASGVSADVEFAADGSGVTFTDL